MLREIERSLRRGWRRRFGAPFSSAAYWERRYRDGRDSGFGSRGALAAYKARALNDFFRRHECRSAIEFGCGDGEQAALLEIEDYLGLDVAPSAVARAAARNAGAPGRRFAALDELAPDARADIALSLDVVYHLVEDEVFEAHMRALIAHAARFVAVYASDRDEITEDRHIRHRAVSGWFARAAPDWRLIESPPNPHREGGDGDGPRSFAAFRFFARDRAPA